MAKDRKKVQQSFAEVVSSFRAAVAAAHKLAPVAVVLLVVIASAVVGLSLWSSTLMVGIVLLIVWCVSLLVYAKTANFGEAALALVAGLLTVFSVEWTPLRFIAFSVAWVGFAGVALLISSVRVAGRVESIYRQAAVAMSHRASEIPKIESRLREIGEKSEYGQVGPVERAEILRRLSFRKVPIELMKQTLKAVETISVITDLPPGRVAAFFADISKATEDNPEEFAVLLTALDRMIMQSAVAPEVFIAGFENSRHFLLGDVVAPTAYFELLQEGLENGLPPDQVAEWLENKLK